MRYLELCKVYQELEKNPSRLKKTEILAEFLKKLFGYIKWPFVRIKKLLDNIGAPIEE